MSASCAGAVCPTVERVHGEQAEPELERWYAARGWPTETGRPADGAAGGDLWLPTGDVFDVVEVPESAGREAVGRLLGHGQAALRPGPVGLTGTGRCGFLVAPGGAEDLPELLEWLDWGGIELGITAYGEGGRVPAPGLGDWLHDPSAPAPEVIALLATIAQACWLDRLGRTAGAGAAVVPAVVPAARVGSQRGVGEVVTLGDDAGASSDQGPEAPRSGRGEPAEMTTGASASAEWAGGPLESDVGAQALASGVLEAAEVAEGAKAAVGTAMVGGRPADGPMAPLSSG